MHADIGLYGYVFCIGCNEKVTGSLHSNCIDSQDKCKDCRNCTQDRTRMNVEDFHKAQYLVKHFITNEVTYKKLISKMAKNCTSVNRNLRNMDNFYQNFMNESYKPSYFFKECFKEIYDFLREKYELTDASIVADIKEGWYRRRSGCSTKSAKCNILS
jgi:hypothetical protein